MKRTVQEHVADLEARIEQLGLQLMQEDDVTERNRLEAEIRAAITALAHYRAAVELERTLS